MVEPLKNIRLYADTHAIEVANFSVNLGLAIDHADLRRFNEKSDELRELFPAMNSAEVLQISLGSAPNAAFRTPSPMPIQDLTFFASDGRPVWKGTFGENKVLVSCRKYTKWEKIWPEAKSRLDLLLGCIDPYKPVFSVDYSVTDTFSALKTEEVLLAPNIFKENRFVPTQILKNTDPRWDFSQGWFEDLQAQDQVLIRVECKSGIQNDQVLTSISNVHSQRFGAGLGAGELVKMPSTGGSRADMIFDSFHDRNKDFLKSVLVDDLLVRMRLKEAGNV